MRARNEPRLPARSRLIQRWAPSGFQGKLVEVRDDKRDVVVRGWLYIPPNDDAEQHNVTPIAGLIVLAPGSGGGLGPGVTEHPQPLANAPRASAYGAMYGRLGHELAHGVPCRNWNDCLAERNTKQLPPRRRAAAAGTRGGKAPRAAANKRKPRHSRWARCVTFQMDWTIIPRKRLRRQPMLQSAVDDCLVAARFLQRRWPRAPLVLAGFSFGGPAVWPAALVLLREASAASAADGDAAPLRRPLAGVCSIAGSGRGGDKYAAAGLHTRACIQSVSGGAVASLFLQGSHDKNVALQVAEYLFEAARAPACFARVNYSPHMMDCARAVAYPFFRDWVARQDSAEHFCRLEAPCCTAMGWLFIPAYCFAVP